MGFIRVCEHCMKVNCSGKMYRAKGSDLINPVCETQTYVDEEGKRYYWYVRGHDEEFEIEVEEN